MNRLNSLLNSSVCVGKIARIPISLHITILFFLLPLLSNTSFSPAHTLEYSVLLVLTILLHELGHALTAKHYRMSGLSIMLHGFGGFATSGGYRSPKQALLIVLAGPAVTFAVGILASLAGSYGLRGADFAGEASMQFFLLKGSGM